MVTLLPSPPLSGFHVGCGESLSSNSPLPLFPRKSFAGSLHRRPFVIAFSYRTKKAFVDNDEKRALLEKYGIDAGDFLSTTLPAKKMGRNMQPLEEPKPPRETHKLLQVLGGTARRKKLLSPKGMDVRPMMEVVKGAAFGILQAAGGSPQSLQPGRWLDLYSGTGSVGIEAISRGCSEVHFVEMDPWVVSDILMQNLDSTGFRDVSVIHTTKVENFLKNASGYLGKDWKFDYISVTPPYMLVDYADLMHQISNSSLVGENTFIVVEYPLKTDMSDSCSCLVKIADRRFGRTQLAIYGPVWAQKKNKLEK